MREAPLLEAGPQESAAEHDEQDRPEPEAASQRQEPPTEPELSVEGAACIAFLPDGSLSGWATAALGFASVTHGLVGDSRSARPSRLAWSTRYQVAHTSAQECTVQACHSTGLLQRRCPGQLLPGRGSLKNHCQSGTPSAQHPCLHTGPETQRLAGCHKLQICEWCASCTSEASIIRGPHSRTRMHTLAWRGPCRPAAGRPPAPRQGAADSAGSHLRRYGHGELQEIQLLDVVKGKSNEL